MATASSRMHLINQLSRKGRSSPSEEEFATASSFDAGRDAIHSTLQLPEVPDNNTAQQQLSSHQQPLNYNQFQDDIYEDGSDGSTEMSIELGRGVKRGARDNDPDNSSNFVFNMGDGSFYEVAATPPLHSRDSQRKKDDGLRRQASVRHAAESTKTNGQPKPTTSMKSRSLSEALKQIGMEDDSSFVAENTAQHTSTFNARNTRFARSKQTSAPEHVIPTRTTSVPTQPTSRQTGANNTTAQSNSFVLPSLPNVNELVSGVRKDGTPVFNRNTKSASRFVSSTYTAAHQQYHRVGSVVVPEEEKAIYASLQLLKNQSERLEMELSEAQKRNEEFESEISDLRSQLTVLQRRPDSALGSDEDVSDHGQWQKEKRNLQASVKALQERHDRSERKISVSEIAVKRVTKERDELLAQLGVAYFDNQELKGENETYREKYPVLQIQNQELKDEVNALRKENQELRLVVKQTQASYEHDSLQRERKEAALRKQMQQKPTDLKQTRDVGGGIWEAKDSIQTKQDSTVRSGKEGRIVSETGGRERPKSAGAVDDTMRNDLAKKIAEQVQKHREAVAAKAQGSLQQRASVHGQIANGRSRSKSTTQQPSGTAERKESATKRTLSAPVETNPSDAESTTQLDFSQHSRKVSQEPSLPTVIKTSRPTMAREEDSRDLTLLSWQDPEEVLNLRKKLEEELRSGKLKGSRSEPVGRSATPPVPDVAALRKEVEEEFRAGKLKGVSSTRAEKDTTQQIAPNLPRKSSMKDATSGNDDPSARFTVGGNTDNLSKVVKSVRVQSPHTSDEYSYVNPPEQSDVGDTSTLSNTSRRRRRTLSAEFMTSAFIVPDITFNSASFAGADTSTMATHNYDADSGNATRLKNENIVPAPVPVTDREDPDVTDATIRPAQAPPLALASVIKQLQDEIKRLKINLAAQQRLYNQHDPAISKRKRVSVKSLMDTLTSEIERRSDQVYALYDVLEGQKEAAVMAENAGKQPKPMDEQEIEDTLSSLGLDPADFSGRIAVGRGENEYESVELPWEGF